MCFISSSLSVALDITSLPGKRLPLVLKEKLGIPRKKKQLSRVNEHRHRRQSFLEYFLAVSFDRGCFLPVLSLTYFLFKEQNGAGRHRKEVAECKCKQSSRLQMGWSHHSANSRCLLSTTGPGWQWEHYLAWGCCCCLFFFSPPCFLQSQVSEFPVDFILGELITSK